MASESQSSADTGLSGSLRRLGRSLLRVLQTRVEILSTEIAEERFNLTRLVVVSLAVLFWSGSTNSIGSGPRHISKPEL